MPELETARHQLRQLAVSQAQKGITYYEALARIDALLHPVAQDERSAPPVLSEPDCHLGGGKLAVQRGVQRCADKVVVEQA